MSSLNVFRGEKYQFFWCYLYLCAQQSYIPCRFSEEFQCVSIFSPIFDAYCRKHYGNGFCDVGCNNAGCNWDGLDCEPPSPPALASGMVSVIVLIDEASFRQNVNTFLREVRYYGDIFYKFHNNISMEESRQISANDSKIMLPVVDMEGSHSLFTP